MGNGPISDSGAGTSGSTDPSAATIAAGITAGAGTGQGTTFPGVPSALAGATIWVPDQLNGDYGTGGGVPGVPWAGGAGPSSNMHQETVTDFINSVINDPNAFQMWADALHNAGILTDPPAGNDGRYTTPQLEASLAKLVAAVGPGGNVGTTMNNLTQEQASQPGQPSNIRTYKGSATEIGLTQPDTVQAVGNAVAQQLIGKNLTTDQIHAITQQLNQQEIAEGQTRAQVSQQQQLGTVEAFTGGSTSGGGTTSPGGGSGGGSSFSQQAVTAANDFAAALSAAGGDAVKAENYYQTGKVDQAGDGAAVFQQYVNNGKALAEMPKELAAQLQQLESAGQLPKGVTAQMLAGIWIAEGRNATDPGSNSAGYGGFFGLSEGQRQAGTSGATTQSLGTTASVSSNTEPATVPGVTQIPGGSQLPAVPGAYQFGGGNTLTTAQGTTVNVEPAFASIVNQPLTPEAATASWLENHDSSEYNAQNLANVFGVIEKMASGTAQSQGKPQ